MAGRCQAEDHGLQDVFACSVDCGHGAGGEVEGCEEAGGCDEGGGLLGVEEEFGVGYYGGVVFGWWGGWLWAVLGS